MREQKLNDSVTVVVPTRNRHRLLVRTLTAILHQQVDDLEVIVVDDGSTDGTSEIVKRLGDDRIRLIRSTLSLGVARARNLGMEVATKTWVAFNDDDDLWSPRKLALQLASLRAHPQAQWCVTGAATIDQSWQILNSRTPPPAGDVEDLLLRCNRVPGGGSGVLVSTALALRTEGFDPQLSMLADWDMWIRLALLSPLATVPEPLVLSLRHDGNMSLDVSHAVHELDYIGAKYAVKRAARNVGPHDRGMLRWIAWTEARAGRRRASVRLYVLGARQERSWRLLGRAGVAALGPQAVSLWEQLRLRRTDLKTLERAEIVVAEVRHILREIGC